MTITHVRTIIDEQEYGLAFKGLQEPEVLVRIYQKAGESRYSWVASHFTKTPDQSGPHRPSHVGPYNQPSEALEAAKRALTDFYSGALAKGRPTPDWFLPNEDY